MGIKIQIPKVGYEEMYLERRNQGRKIQIGDWAGLSSSFLPQNVDGCAVRNLEVQGFLLGQGSNLS